MHRLSEQAALTKLQRLKTSYQTSIRRTYERAAEDCRACSTPGACCLDAHFVNVHVTRLEAVAIRETIERTPRLSEEEKREVYHRARQAVRRYSLRASGETFAQTFACPLYVPRTGCLVHRRAKPAPCIQHACYSNWEDLPPDSLQARVEHRVEELNREVYGAGWNWLPLPLWLVLLDPRSDGLELQSLIHDWSTRRVKQESNSNHHARRKNFPRRDKKVRSLPVLS
ncbi:MAG TPA: hypothetical protein VJS44_07200 [Pyrinomonadaceae bacterium]|nr:hypothetical protein [Pyrinomonadaceae bacterium]